MRLSAFHIAALAVIILCSCSREEGKVIPKAKLARIYAEMFVADQKIGGDTKARSMADTSYVYEPIFEKYGYTSDDYRASMSHYIKDADRYAKILRETSIILEEEIAELKRQKAAMAPLEEALDAMERNRPDRIFFMTGIGCPSVFHQDSVDFYIDSTGGRQYFDAREWLDTAYFGPVMEVKSDVPAVSDTVGVTDGRTAPGDGQTPVEESGHMKHNAVDDGFRPVRMQEGRDDALDSGMRPVNVKSVIKK